MNTFVADKLGEVLAFARVGADTLKKGRKSLYKILNKSEVQKIEKTLKDIEKNVLDFSGENNVKKEVEKKAKEAQIKITKMRNTYIGRKWDEVDELLEWTGFYAGAALVHWKLISGAAKSMKSKELASIAKVAVTFYDALFIFDERKLEEIGAKRNG